MKAPEILDRAAQHMRDRAATYDKPEGERSMAQTVAVFNLFHGTALTEAQGWHMLQILKDVRLFSSDGYHADSAEDCTAYSALKAEAMAAQAETKPAATAPVVVPHEPEYGPDSVAFGGWGPWIDWVGGERPVDRNAFVEYRFRGGHSEARQLIWSHDSGPGDIVRYRIKL